MNLVGVWFGIIERQAIHRGSYGSVKDLNAKSERSYPAGTTVATPFVWTKTPEQILKKANHQTTSNTTQLALACPSATLVLSGCGCRRRDDRVQALHDLGHVICGDLLVPQGHG